jgi:hypothetical protein
MTDNANTVRKNSIEFQIIGLEPIITDPITDRNDPQLRHAYMWYSYTQNVKAGRVWLDQCLTASDYPVEKHKKLKKVSDEQVPMVCCSIARLINNGAILPEETLQFFFERIERILAENVVVKEKSKFSEKPVVSIRDRIEAIAAEMIAEIEEQVDQLILDPKHTFSAYQYLTDKQTNSKVARIVGAHFFLNFEELAAAYRGLDDQLIEGYSWLTKPQLKKQVDFFKSIVEDCTRFGSNKVSARKPRKKKQKSAVQLTQKVSYKKEFPPLKIVSINPAEVVGSTSLWVFNTKYNVLTSYIAASEIGLSIKGTTIQNFNKELSISKRLGKPSQVIEKILSGGKVTLRRVMEEIRAKPSIPNGRLNGEIVLLKALK